MKKLLCVTIVLLLCGAMLAGCGGSAYDGTAGLEFTKVSKLGSSSLKEELYSGPTDAYAVTDYTGSDSVVQIPAEYRGKPVTVIQDAFKYLSHVTQVMIPDSVTYINYSAFFNCNALTEITIPSSVTYIGSHAFYLLSAVTELVIPDSVTYIDSAAFSGCQALRSVTIGEGVTYIGEYAFASCASLTKVTMGNAVTEIGSHAFEFCTSLTDVEFGSGLVKIGDWAFYKCPLGSVALPDSLTSIGDRAFGDDVFVGTEINYYQQSLPTQDIFAQAETHLGETLSQDKWLGDEDISALGGLLTGPLVYLGYSDANAGIYYEYWIPDVEAEEYGPDVITDAAVMLAWDLSELEASYQEMFLSRDEGAGAESDIVYALCECTGYHIVEYLIGPNLHKLSFRISFRRLADDELLGWYEYTIGYAPATYDTEDNVYFRDANNNPVCLDHEGHAPAPLHDMLERLYGEQE